MKTLLWFQILLFGLLQISCESKPEIPREITENYPLKLTLYAKNEADLQRNDETITVGVDILKAAHSDFNPQAFVVFEDSDELSSQAWDSKGDGQPDQLAFVTDFSPGEEKTLSVYYASEGAKKREYPQRAQAELSYKTGGEFKKNEEGRYEYMGGKFKNADFLRVPPKHSDHSWFIRYEGPGWESDKVGYRFYLDWRNATDIFGKKTRDMVLQNVGQDGFDSYHEMSDWGMDILKVGDALGIGGIGMWTGKQVERVSKTDSISSSILASGPVHAEIKTVYYGWQVADGNYDLTSNLSINAGSRMTRHDVNISGNPQNLCTGIVKHENVSLIESPATDEGWAYLATYGKQSLDGDSLGMAVLYNKENYLNRTGDENNFVVVLQPAGGQLHYYFLAAWEQEPQGITSEAQFRKYLETVRQKLNQPIQVDVK